MWLLRYVSIIKFMLLVIATKMIFKNSKNYCRLFSNLIIYGKWKNTRVTTLSIFYGIPHTLLRTFLFFCSHRYQWSEAIFNFLPSVPAQYVNQFTSKKDYVGDSKITIVSYDLLVRSIELFAKQIFGFVILVSLTKISLQIVQFFSNCNIISGRIS